MMATSTSMASLLRHAARRSLSTSARLMSEPKAPSGRVTVSAISKPAEKPHPVPDFIRKWAFNASGFNRLGLYHDDNLFENPDVKEAIRRLPLHIQDERNYRIVRAMQLEIMKQVLPKEEWVQWEDDIVNGRYLQPYLDEVLAERKERETWAKRV